ncbi:MAG: hypothetical protein NT027_03115 [Proteobacteria bacterium]|nr:hypothetical protein [Pseudomonadota bacterium]
MEAIYSDIDKLGDRLSKRDGLDIAITDAASKSSVISTNKAVESKANVKTVTKSSSQDGEIVYAENVVVLEAVVSDLLKLKSSYPEYEVRLNNEIDILSKAAASMRILVGLPTKSGNESSSLQLGDNETPLTLPQIRGQLSALRASANKIEARVRGERAGAEAKALQARRNQHDQRIKDKFTEQSRYIESANEATRQYYKLEKDLNDHQRLLDLTLQLQRANRYATVPIDGAEVPVSKLVPLFREKLAEAESKCAKAWKQVEDYTSKADRVGDEIAQMRGNYPK